MEEQIGREATPTEYISRLTEVFTEVRRVLRSDGTLWLNIADTYAGKGNQGDFVDPKNPKGRNGQSVALNYKVEGCKPKDMIGIPWMLAFALRDSGWYLRNDIIKFVRGKKQKDEDMDFFDDEGYEEEPYINEDEEPQIADDESEDDAE